MDETPNAEAIEAWDGVLFDKFCRFRHLLTTGLSSHSDEVLQRHPPAEGARVLDIGCGFGDLTQVLARRVGETGEVVGVDASKRFVAQAAQEAADAGVERVRFVATDAQTGALGGPYDAAYSRFGTMFFSAPVAAMRNVRQSLKPGGILTMVVWRRREDNLWLYAAEQCVRQLVPERENADAPTCGPGPFSMAGADMVSDQLLAAGLSEISFQRFDADICIGRDLDEAVEFAMALGPAGEVIRLAGEDAERLKPQVQGALREGLSQFAGPKGVYAPSSTWFVRARAPRR